MPRIAQFSERERGIQHENKLMLGLIADESPFPTILSIPMSSLISPAVRLAKAFKIYHASCVEAFFKLSPANLQFR